MHKLPGTIGKIFNIFTVIFCGLMFYLFFLKTWPDIPGLLASFAFWLIISFMLITLSIGTGKGIHRTKIKIPKKPAIVVFFISGILLLIAVSLNGGI